MAETDLSDDLVIRICDFLGKNLIREGKCARPFPTSANQCDIGQENKRSCGPGPFERMQFFISIHWGSRGGTSSSKCDKENVNVIYRFGLLHIKYAPAE